MDECVLFAVAPNDARASIGVAQKVRHDPLGNHAGGTLRRPNWL